MDHMQPHLLHRAAVTSMVHLLSRILRALSTSRYSPPVRGEGVDVMICAGKSRGKLVAAMQPAWNVPERPEEKPMYSTSCLVSNAVRKRAKRFQLCLRGDGQFPSRSRS